MIQSNAIAACVALSDRIQQYLGRRECEIELLNSTLKITAGQYRGLVLTFYADDSCLVSCNRFSLCIDLGAGRSADQLVRILMQHRIIADERA